MYRPLIFLAFICFLFSASQASAAMVMECHAKVPPRINVKPSQTHVKYDFTKTKAQLNARDVDTISPYGPQHKTNVSGLMSGAIKLTNNTAFLHEVHPYTGEACVFLKSIDVQINLAPTIFIAKEFPKGGCMHTTILAHEMKHVDVDQRLVNKYINVIGHSLSEMLDEKGGVYGPIHKDYMNEQMNIVKDFFHGGLIRLNDDLNKERRKNQQAIDTLKEYQSIGDRCKSVNKPRRW